MIKPKSRIEEISSSQSKYCYKNSDVLINKLGIKDAKQLEQVETAITTFKLAKLHLKPIKGYFDIKHYLNIHHFLFNDLYDFAGKIRDENIKKDNTPFCRPEYIYNYLQYTLEEMRIKAMDITSEEQLIAFLAYYYSELNIIHPFREGNGRTEREFFREYIIALSEKLDFGNYELDYRLCDVEDRKKLISGSILSAHTKDFSLLKEFFGKALVNLEKTKKTSKNR